MLDTSRFRLDLMAHIHVKQTWTKRDIKLLDEGRQGKLVNYMPDSTRVFINPRAFINPENNTVKPIRAFIGLDDNAVTPEIREIPQRLASALLFVHDLAKSLSREGYLQSGSLTNTPEGIGPKVRTVFGREENVLLTGKAASSLEWQLPQWWTFRDIDRFTIHWGQHVGQCESQYGLAWLAAILEVVLNESCKPGINEGLKLERLRGLLARLVSEKPVCTAREVLRDSTLFCIATLFAPEFRTDIKVQDFQGVGFFEAIESDRIKFRILRMRASIFQSLDKKDNDIDEQLSAIICTDIAPGVLWKRIMEAMKPILVRLNLSVANLPNLCQIPKSATEAFPILKGLRDARSTISDDSNMREFDKLMGKAEDVFESMRTSHFFLLKDGAFIPTEEDINRAQP